MAVSKKRKVEVPSAKIDSFFKRISKPQKPATNEGNINENDENQSCSQESTTKKSFGLKDTATIKPLGLKDTTTAKPLGLKDTAEQSLELSADSKPSKDALDKKTRQPLKEKAPQSSSPLKLSSTVKTTTRSFNVLCDDDIDKGIKQAPEVQPKAFQVFADDQEELDTQHIRTCTPNSSQRTDCTSPIEYLDDGEQYGSQESNQVVLSQRIDENEIRQDEEEEGLRRTNENELYDDDDDDCDLRLITKTTHKENIVRPILLKKEEKEDRFEVFTDEPNLVPAGSSSGFGIFFDDDEDDKENDYVDPDLEFSISSVTSVPIEDSLLTLSPATEDKVKEVHAPLPYPRGENIVQKLGLEKSSNNDDDDDDDDKE